MEQCRIAKLPLGEFQGFISSIVPKAASTKPISRFHSNFSSTLTSSGSTIPKFPRFSSWHHIFTTRTTQHSSFFSVSKRYNYHGDHQSEFRRRCYQCNQWVKRNPKEWLAFFIIILVRSAVVVSVLLGRFETIPYSKRTHFVFSNTNWEKKLGQFVFNKMKEQFKGRILPDMHPETIRVRAIVKDLIRALNRGMNLEQDYDEPALMDDFNKESKNIVIRDDMYIEKSRKKGKQRGSRDAISHLNGLSLEILVVDEPMVNALCLPGGKIVVFTGLLNHFSSDAEIATMIGHEVGHAVGRHCAEKITKGIWILILQLLLVVFVEGDIVKTFYGHVLSKVLFSLPNSRRMEMEADHIGLLLVAAAGYDPTLAPGAYKKLSEITGESKKDYLSTHPSVEKRAENLSRAKIMEEALSIYRDVKSRRAWG